MNFDPKAFVAGESKARADAKEYIRDLCERIVLRFLFQIKLLNVPHVTIDHIRLVAFQLAAAPATALQRDELLVHANRVTDTARIFMRAIDMALDRAGTSVDTNIVAHTAAMCAEQSIKLQSDACLAISACAAEICGIITNGAVRHGAMLTVARLQHDGTMYTNSSGETFQNESLRRTIHCMKHTRPAM